MNPVNIGFLLEWEQDRRLRLPLPPGGMTLGRGPGNDYSFPEEDLAPIQCKLFQRDRRVHILDLSGKGTDVNGKLVEQGVLAGNESIRLGRFTLRLIVPQDETSSQDRQKTRKLSHGAPKAASVNVSWTLPTGKTLDHRLNGSVVIGSDADCGIRLADPYVSAQHCALMPTGNEVILRDLDSTNGTWIGKLRILETALHDGCEFRVGSVRFRMDMALPVDSQKKTEEWPHGIVGRHPSLLSALSLLRRMAPLPVTVLILGETGTGKELFARALHAMSSRASGAFVPVNCAAIGKELMESR